MDVPSFRLLDMSNTNWRDDLDTFERDARYLPASEDARRSVNEAAGCLETPAVILDWHYARSPFAASMQEARELLGVAAPSDGGGDDMWSPYVSAPAQVRRWEASNDNRRLWVVK